jgi:hypothetical protein
MHPLNTLRLQAGIVIDPAIEVTKKPQLDEARKVPLRRDELTSKDQKSLTHKVTGLNSAIKHIQNAVKALDKIPATDFMGDIPHFIQELEYVLEGEGGGSGLIHLLDGFDKDQKNHLKDERKVAKVKYEEEEADAFNQQCHDIDVEDEKPLTESRWTIKVKHRDTTGFDIQASTRDEAEQKANARLAKMRGGKGLIISIKSNTDITSSEDSRYARAVDKMSDDDKGTLFKKADQKSRSGGSLTPLEDYVLKTSNYKTTKQDEKKEDNKENTDNNETDVKESMHYYVNNQYTNYEDDEDKPVNVTDGSANNEQVWDGRSEDNAEDNRPNRVNGELQSDVNDVEGKMTIPADIKNQLRASIEQSRKEAKRYDTSNENAANFHTNLARAFEDLLDKLDTGTIYDFKQAQIFAQTFMGPMLASLPTDVWKFLANGGKARSLKSYMQEV